MAEAFYGVPQKLKEACIRRLPEDLLGVALRLEQRVKGEAN